MSLRDDLIAAKALIDAPEKWAKGPGMWGSHRQCAMQALRFRGHLTFKLVADAIPFRWKLRQWFRRRWSILASANIIRFNDDPSTTHADIMALFQRAIDAVSKEDAAKGFKEREIDIERLRRALSNEREG